MPPPHAADIESTKHRNRPTVCAPLCANCLLCFSSVCLPRLWQRGVDPRETHMSTCAAASVCIRLQHEPWPVWPCAGAASAEARRIVGGGACMPRRSRTRLGRRVAERGFWLSAGSGLWRGVVRLPRAWSVFRLVPARLDLDRGLRLL